MCILSILLSCTILYMLKMNVFPIRAAWKLCYLIFYILTDIFVSYCQIFFCYSSLGARKWPLQMTFTKDTTSLNYLVSTNVTKIIEKITIWGRKDSFHLMLPKASFPCGRRIWYHRAFGMMVELGTIKMGMVAVGWTSPLLLIPSLP